MRRRLGLNNVLLLLFFAFSAKSEHGCFTVFGEFNDTLSKTIDQIPEIRRLPKTHSPSGVKEYQIDTAGASEILESGKYQQFLDETVEILYKDIPPFGHISLRIGDQFYSFNHVQRTSINQFSLSRMGGQKGFVFQSKKEVIQEMREKVERFYKDSQKYNVPPFDAYAPQLEVKRLQDGSLRYRSPSPNNANDRMIHRDVRLVDDKDQAFLVTPTGGKYPVVKKKKKYFTQSYSCSSATTCMMSNFLGMPLDAELGKGGAKFLKSFLEKNLEFGFSDLKAVIHY